jgi:hypothetical protein
MLEAGFLSRVPNLIKVSQWLSMEWGDEEEE